MLFLLATTTVFSQDVKTTIRHTVCVSYQQAYLNCSASELVKLVDSHATTRPQYLAATFLRKYPILHDISCFKKRKKYSLINVDLLVKEPEFTDDNKLIFYLKNGKTYQIKLVNRIKDVYF